MDMITEIIEKLKKFFEMREEVQFAVLFGSLAKGATNTLSDIDIAVMVVPEFKDTFPYGYQAALTADLMQELKRNDVDVVILNQAPIALKYQVLRYGKFIHIRGMFQKIVYISMRVTCFVFRPFCSFAGSGLKGKVK